MDPKSEISFPVDLIRTVAIILVILLHAATEQHTIVNIMAPGEVTLWFTSDFYNTLARPCVPLFLMLTGVLLLQPSKVDEPLRVFFKKRWRRIGLPFIFWGIAYFAWRFFVNGEALTASSILQGILTGPYLHFWFLYLLVGVYLVTPVFRVVLKYADRKVLKYFFIVWFVGTGVVPLITLFEPYGLNADVFLITGWVGYFILSTFLIEVKVRSSILYVVLFLGYFWTAVGSYLVVYFIGERFSQFFFDSFSLNVIGASMSLFLILSRVSPQRIESRFPRVNGLLSVISQNTLPIYLFHVMVLETLQKGYLGFKISVTSMNPILEIPLITFIALFVSLGVILPLKKVPYLRRLIG